MDNKKIKEKLIGIQKNEKEPFLFPILKQLFAKKGFENVQITHGPNEFGKDLVFYEYDEKLGKKRWFAVVVKNKNARQADFENGGEIIRQIETAFKNPYKNEKAEKKYINFVIVAVNGSVTKNAEEILAENIHPSQITNVDIWNYQRIGNEIEKFLKDEFLSNDNGVSDKNQITINVFREKQIAKLSDISNSRELFQGLELKEIDDIYVNAKTTYNKYKNDKKNYAYGKPDRKNKLKEEFDEAKIILNSNNNFIIHGIAASGKSLLLKRIGVKSLDVRNIATFYIELRKYNKNVETFNINKIITEQYWTLTNKEKFNIDDFSKTILLFDGLDEIKSDDEKIYVINRIWFSLCDFEIEKNTIDILSSIGVPEYILSDLKKIKNSISTEIGFRNEVEKVIGESASKEFFKDIIKYAKKTENSDLKKKFQIVISSRSIELIEDKDLLTSFEKVELLPFDLGQAFKLVKKIIPGNKEKANNFINAIKHSQLSNSLTRTPMALTLTAILYRDGEIDLSELPANVTELYNKYSDYYLNRWDTSKGISLQYKYEEAKNILSFIAKELHARGIQEIEEQELITFLTDISKKYPYEDLKDIDKFIDELKNRVGLVQFDNREKLYKFYHLSFQEYFTSVYYSDDSEKNLFDNYLSEWWENTIIFYCGKQPRRDVFLKKATKNIIPTDIEQTIKYLDLTSKCIQAAHLIPNETQENIITQMIYYFDKLYKMLVSSSNSNFLKLYSKLDLIMQLRDFFYRLFDTKHIYSETMENLSIDLLTNRNEGISVVTLYSLSYFMSSKTGNALFLEEFLKLPELEKIWSRIIFTDLSIIKLNNSIDIELYDKIKKIQRRKQQQIELSFRQSAVSLINENKN